MLFSGLEPDHVSGTDLFDRTPLTLGSTGAGGDDENLTEWMRVPCCARTGLECDRVPRRACWSTDRKQGIDSYDACEPICRSFARRLRAGSGDLHCRISLPRENSLTEMKRISCPD